VDVINKSELFPRPLTKNMLLGLILLVATGLLLFGLIQWHTLEWQNLVVITSGVALAMGAVAVFIIAEKRKYRLEQVRFLTSLAEDFCSRECMYLEAWPILRKYKEVPKEMGESEWKTVIHALRGCYGSVSFIFQVSQLVEKGLIDIDLLYLFYFDKVTGYCPCKLRDLITWCGTGLDLAADYDPHELARIIKAVRGLVMKLYRINKKPGGCTEGAILLMEDFDAKARDFLADPPRFEVGSDNYAGNYVNVREWGEIVNRD